MNEKWNWMRIINFAVLLCAVTGDVQYKADVSNKQAIEQTTEEATLRAPSVFIAILARNTAHTLPYFFSYIDRLDYPKDRIYMW